jgi:hypothetical protein
MLASPDDIPVNRRILMSGTQPQVIRSLEEQRAEFARRRGLAMPLAGLVVWTLIGIAGAFLPPILAVWSLFIGAGFIAYLPRRTRDCRGIEANREKKAMVKRFFPEGKDSKKRAYQDFRWSRFKNFDPRDMYEVVNDHVFPWLRTLGGNGTTYSKHMEGARFTIPTPALLAKVVDMIDKVPMEDRDTKGDLYEYMLGKIATAGQNGQFRTPRHIIRLMVEMVEPKATDIVCDPACGTCGFPGGCR